MDSTTQQNAHLTFKANKGIGRHDWLRLTPAYSVNLVKSELENYKTDTIVFDPFSGTGTTGLCAAERGHHAVLADINPFLIWLAETKTRNYSHKELNRAKVKLGKVIDTARELKPEDLWVPPLHNIERWWNPNKLLALARLKAAIELLETDQENDLLLIAFCDSLIKESNATFNHQSVSFKQVIETEALFVESEEPVFYRFRQSCEKIFESARYALAGSVSVIHTDSRDVEISTRADLVITSPPYVNRMSYIRELRPYMYWLRFLKEAKEAGELDWKTIGGTWGTATSKLNNWSDKRTIPIRDIKRLTDEIAKGDAKNGRLLGNYVMKYFYDMWEHFIAMHKIVNKGGKLIYIIGNSSFYGNVVPAEEWYADLMSSAGFENIKIETIRKRNSNKALFEFAVSAEKLN